MSTSRIIIGADIVPTKTNCRLFETEDISGLLGEKLAEYMRRSDYTVLNLESPLTDVRTPILKCGPCLSSPEVSVKGLKQINPYFYTLANNHIMDQGESGLKTTIELLKKNDIQFAGAGFNLDEAKKPFTTCIDGIKVGIYCCAEHEFSIAKKDKAGANPFDFLSSFEDVQALKKECDIVIVLYHGGKEQYRYPSPMLQKVFRKFAKSGADLVIAQHTHCIGCYEEYDGSVLLYGQGNFLFDNADNEYWNTSLLLEVDIYNGDFNYKFVPIVKKANVVRLADNQESMRILKDFESRSSRIRNPEVVEQCYNEYANTRVRDYYCVFLGRFGSLMYKLDRLFNGKLLRYNYSKRKECAMLNYIECEAHKELLECIIKSRINL